MNDLDRVLFRPSGFRGNRDLRRRRPGLPSKKFRKGLREMSNLELRRFGEPARKLSDPKMNFGSTELRVKELEEARAEWRRRHP